MPQAGAGTPAGADRRTAAPTRAPTRMPTATSSGGHPTTLLIMRTPSSRSTSTTTYGPVVGVAARPRHGLHARRVHDAVAARRRATRPRRRDSAGRPSRGYQIGRSHSVHHGSTKRCSRGRVPERGRLVGRRRFAAGGHSVASVPSTTVPMDDSTPPEPWATAISASGTWRSPHSPRSCRTASTSRNMPYCPGCV